MMSRISPFVQGNEHPPVLLVDGYNVLHMYVQHMQESQPKHAMATTQVLEDLRTGLESEMVAYSQARRIKVVVVYDAMNRPPDPIYVDIRTSTRLAHSAFNCLSTYVQNPDVLPCSLCTTFLQNHKVTYQRCWDTHIRRSLQDASGDTALFTIVTLIPARRGSYAVQSGWRSCMHLQESLLSYNLLQCIINRNIVVSADSSSC